MNKKEIYFVKYKGDTRYEKVWEQMQLLGIEDVSTKRQSDNNTIVWRLPIKNKWNNGSFIEVASFKTGYVRNQNSGYSNYQLNKRQFEDEYFQAYEWKTINGEYQQVKIPGQYRKWSRKTCVMIPIEIDRLEYLISYCLKNYYIKRANEIANGDFVPKWKYDDLADAARLYYEKHDCGHYERINGLEDKLEESDYRIKDLERMLDGYKTREKDLENKLDTIKRIADYE